MKVAKTMRTRFLKARLQARSLVLFTVAAVVAGTIQELPAQAKPEPAAGAVPAQASVAAADRDRVLGKSWRSSTDRAWTTAGDAEGFHVLVADAADGYQWRTVATLAEPGFDTDRWIGNACLTSSGRRIAVVYAPRAFTNRADLSGRGGFTAVVDLTTGAVTKLAVTTSLAYFNPGCGVGESVALTQEGDDEHPGTRLQRLDAANGKLASRLTFRGQLTSAVPTADGFVGAIGGSLVKVGARGAVSTLTRASDTPFSIRPDSSGGINYLELTNTGMAARRFAGTSATTLAEGGRGAIGLQRGAAGRVFLTGNPTRVRSLPASVTRLPVSATAEVSTTGGLAVERVMTAEETLPGAARSTTGRFPVRLAARVVPTGQSVAFAATPETVGPVGVARQSPALRTLSPTGAVPAGPSTAATVASLDPSSPMDADAWCSVPRNDVSTMAYHPRPRQVEWAVDYAIFGALTTTRPANYRKFGLPAYSPQGMFPPRSLVGAPDGHVAAQIMLGILTQESNLWQASQTESGEYGNPLIGNYYGRPYYDEDTSDDWRTHWDQSDCGYGIGQVTDGMRKAGYAKPGEVIKPAVQQRAIALDYAANIAASLQILQDKWNQTSSGGLVVNNGDPTRIENWYFAIWAYNSGFHPDQGDGSPWGVGWGNNPANPRYLPDRRPFLDVANPEDPDDNVPHFSDAAHPQDWPYQEKVIGWAAQSIDTNDGVGYRTAFWNGETVQARLRRTAQIPRPEKLCVVEINECYFGGQQQPTEPGLENEPPGPCLHRNGVGQFDLKCWYHAPLEWKADCEDSCGYEGIRYDVPDNYAEPTDGTHNPPRCTSTGVPANAVIVDDIPAGSTVPRCGNVTSGVGSFSFEFVGYAGEPTAKIDTHQLDNGYGGHNWFARAKGLSYFQVVGAWRPPATVTGLTEIYIYVPPTGGAVADAIYEVNTGDGRIRRVAVNQGVHPGEWVWVGAFNLQSNVSVTLDNLWSVPTERSIAYDAVAFVSK
jgi:hypothetical protein